MFPHPFVFSFWVFQVRIVRTPCRTRPLRLTAHPAERRALPQLGIRPLSAQLTDTRRASSRPATGGADRHPPVGKTIVPALPGREKGTLFCFAPPCADTLMCTCAALENSPKGGSFSYFGHTRDSIALFRQGCNLIPAQILSEQSIKYGQNKGAARAVDVGFPPFCPCLKKTPPGWVVLRSSKGRRPFDEGGLAPTRAFSCIAARKHTLSAQRIFRDVHAAAKNGWHRLRGLRAANSARLLVVRRTGRAIEHHPGGWPCDRPKGQCPFGRDGRWFPAFLPLPKENTTHSGGVLADLRPPVQTCRLSSHGRSVPPARCSPSRGPSGSCETGARFSPFCPCLNKNTTHSGGVLAGAERLELSTRGFGDRCSTN